MQKLLRLLQISDSMFPIGSFAHSNGLEAYIQFGVVKDTETVKQYVKNMLEHNIFFNDALFLNKAWQYGTEKQWPQIVQLDKRVTALKSPYEIREASRKLCVRFLKLTMELNVMDGSQKYLHEIQNGNLTGHYSIAYGLLAREIGVPKEKALSTFYLNTLNGIVTNCAKLVPISQTVAQKILFDSLPLIEELVRKQDKVKDDRMGLCCMGQEIKCMQHEKLYTRLYIS